MLIIKDTKQIPKQSRGYSVAIGNFDGLHLGHLSVIQLAKNHGQELDTGVLTFEPHPRQFFNKNQSSFRLMNSETRVNTLKDLNLDVLFEIPFNQSLATLKPEDFVENILIEKLNIKHVVVGESFRFGKNRAGSIELLKKYNIEGKLDLTIAPSLKFEDQIVSSSLLREKLKVGSIKEVNKLLNRYYNIVGVVQKGFQRGRDLGFPTINLEIKDILIPRYGVYAAFVEVLSGEYKGKYKGAASIGLRPTYGNNDPNIEVYIFDFNDSLYEENVSVSLVDFLRPEIKFDNELELIEQMKQDCSEILKIL